MQLSSLPSTVTFAGFIVLTAAAPAAIISGSPAWPVSVPIAGNVGYYLSGPTPSYTGGGVTITLDAALLRTLAPVSIVPSGPNETGSFSANMDAIGDVIPLATDLPSNSTGAGQILTLGKVGNVTGTFNTEMLSLNLAGATPLGPFMLRESPTLQSLGQTSITDLGGGQFRIDSFFDVFTELSIDGGQNWFPNTAGSARFTLLPEPGSVMMGGLAGAALLMRRRRHS